MERFEKSYKQGQWGTVTEIWIDRETGVNYLWHRDGNSAGLTPLLNSDGTPIISKIKYYGG